MNIGSLPPASNRATYSQSFQLYDSEDNAGVDLSGAAIVVQLRRPGCASAQLSATNEAGIAITAAHDGAFELTFTVGQMRGLDPLQYECGITIAQNDETVQHFIGTLAVLDGIVS